jgi:hypothetical protein
LISVLRLISGTGIPSNHRKTPINRANVTAGAGDPACAAQLMIVTHFAPRKPFAIMEAVTAATGGTGNMRTA